MAKSLGQHVKDRRKALRMTQADLAKRMRREDRSYLSRIEHDETKAPNVVLLQTLAEALEESLDDLLADTGIKPEDSERSDLTPEQERLIAYTQAHLAHVTAEEMDQLIRMVEAGFADRAPD